MRIEMQGLTEQLALYRAIYPKKATVAQARAIRDTLRWVRTRVKRDAAAELAVRQKDIASRVLTSSVTNASTQGHLWAGLWNLSPYKLGQPSYNPMVGVEVGNRQYMGAFLARIYSGQENIWIRKRSDFYDPALYVHGGRGAGSTPRHLRHRFPVVKGTVRIDEAMAKVFERDEPEIKEYFAKRMAAQLNYAFGIEGKVAGGEGAD